MSKVIREENKLYVEIEFTGDWEFIFKEGR